MPNKQPFSIPSFPLPFPAYPLFTPVPSTFLTLAHDWYRVWGWFSSPNMVPYRLIHVAANDSSLLFSGSHGGPLSMYITFSLSTPLVDGHFCCFHILAIGVMLQWAWQWGCLLTCQCRTRGLYTRECDGCILWLFYFSKNVHTAFCDGFTNSAGVWKLSLSIFAVGSWFLSFWWLSFLLRWCDISPQFCFAFPGWLAVFSIFHLLVGHLCVFFWWYLFWSFAHCLIGLFAF